MSGTRHHSAAGDNTPTKLDRNGFFHTASEALLLYNSMEFLEVYNLYILYLMQAHKNHDQQGIDSQ
jgi:hypothetical protein